MVSRPLRRYAPKRDDSGRGLLLPHICDSVTTRSPRESLGNSPAPVSARSGHLRREHTAQNRHGHSESNVQPEIAGVHADTTATPVVAVVVATVHRRNVITRITRIAMDLAGPDDDRRRVDLRCRHVHRRSPAVTISSMAVLHPAMPGEGGYGSDGNGGHGNQDKCLPLHCCLP